MRMKSLIAVLCLAMAAGCASEYPVFEDRSDEVELRHRIPSK